MRVCSREKAGIKLDAHSVHMCIRLHTHSHHTLLLVKGSISIERYIAATEVDNQVAAVMTLHYRAPTHTALQSTYTHCTTEHLHTRHYRAPTHTALQSTYTHCTTEHLHTLHYRAPTHTALQSTYTHCSTEHLHTLHYRAPTRTALQSTYTHCT